MRQRSILIIEDEVVIRSSLKKYLGKQGFSVTEAGSVEEADATPLDKFDLIITDLRLPGPPGTDIIPRAYPTPVLVMTSYASISSAVDAMKQGAVDYIAKPFDHGDMVNAVQRIISDHPTARAEREKAQQTSGAQAGTPPPSGIVGNCPAMLTLFDHIERMAPTESTVLVS